jgi:hypothetical protein
MKELPPPLPVREAAAGRWRAMLTVCAVVLAACGLIAAVSSFIDLPGAIMWPALAAMVLGIFAVFVGAFGLAWTTGMPWYRWPWLGLRMVGSAFVSFL